MLPPIVLAVSHTHYSVNLTLLHVLVKTVHIPPGIHALEWNVPHHSVFACAVSTGVEAGEGRDIICICDQPHIIALEVCVL